MYLCNLIKTIDLFDQITRDLTIYVPIFYVYILTILLRYHSLNEYTPMYG